MARVASKGSAGGELVGRDAEMARLDAALKELESDPPAIFQVVGEPGIGKSRLLAEVAAHGDARRHLVFAGRAGEFEGTPFAVVVDALDPYLASQNPARFRTLAAEHREELATVFPALAEIADRRQEVLQHERYRAHHAVRSLLELLAAERPCLLLLDDMHWADPASLELVSHLLRRRPDSRVMILLAFRPPQAPERLRVPLERAEREGASVRLRLAPLDRAAAERLLDPSLDASRRETLYRESGGNPFYLDQLARVAHPGTAGAARPGRGIDSGEEVAGDEVGRVPRAVREAIAHEIAGLTDPARIALRGAAVAGDPFTADLAAVAAGVTDGELLTSLDELLALDVVRPAATPVQFRFRHPIVRAAVYASAPAAWRLGAHRRVAAALRDRGAPPAAAATHVERSASPGDEAAIALLTDAGHATAPRAPATAAGWFETSLRLLPEHADDQRRLGLLVPLARSLGASGQLEASRDTLQEVLALLPTELGVVRGQVIAFMSLIEHLLGRHGEARAMLLRALEDLPDAGSPDAATLQVELAADCFFLGEWEEMHAWAIGALGLARDAGDPRVHAAAAALLALSCYELLRPSEARAHIAESREIVDSLSDDELALRIDACHWLGWVEHLLDHYEDSVRHMERGIAISRKTGQGHMLAPMTIGLVIANTWQGRLDDAWQHVEEAVEIAHLGGSDQLMAWAQTMRAWVAVRRGDLDLAIAAGEEAVAIGKAVTKGPYTVVASCWLADALVEVGEPARARGAILAAVAGPELDEVEPAFRSCIYEVLTRAELARGRIDDAADWARRAADAVADLDLPGRESFALRATAEVALARGETGPAVELALTAAEKAGDAYRVDAARARTLAGRALAAGGERKRAIVELERARIELERCSARRYADQAVRELRRQGRKVGHGGRRGQGATGIESLSGRELEVAELVRERLTNRQIAERLVLSEKTIERHLSRIFDKLDASSRVEVARMVERSVSGSR